MKNIMLLFALFLFFASCTPPVSEEGEGFTPPVSTQSGVAMLTPRDSLVYDPRFYKSEYVNPLTVLSDSFQYTLVNPASYRNWSECLSQSTKVKLLPGDYTGWGPIKTVQSGTLNDPIIIRYYDTLQPSAYNRKISHLEAIVEGFKLEGVKHCILSGITIRGKSESKNGIICGMKNSVTNCEGVIIDFCNIENVNVSAIRMTNVINCTVQNSVFQQFDSKLLGDGGAISIQATRGKVSSGNRIVNNEIINYNDGAGFPREGNPQGTDNDLTGECAGNVFENNDIYITSLLYNPDNTACAENSLDFKNGTKGNSKNLVIGNRFFGNRPTGPACGSSGSNGCFISLHRNASGIEFKNNFFFDGAVGFNILQSDDKFPGESMTNLLIQNNLFFELGFGQSAGFVMANTAGIKLNTVKGSQDGVFISNTKADTKDVVKNLFVGVKNVEPTLPVSNRYVTGVNYQDFYFYCKRWTGAKLITARGVLKNNQVNVL